MPRLTKIYTRTGDQGTTGLGDGQRVAKDDHRVEAYGTIDELNSVLALLLVELTTSPLSEPITQIQHCLFDIGGELSIPGYVRIQAQAWQALETSLDALNARLPPLAEFVLPGGSKTNALCHLARTTCRRAERRLVTLHRHCPLNPETLIYLNRLSDWLFVAARILNQDCGGTEVLWQPHRHSFPTED